MHEISFIVNNNSLIKVFIDMLPVRYEYSSSISGNYKLVSIFRVTSIKGSPC